MKQPMQHARNHLQLCIFAILSISVSLACADRIVTWPWPDGVTQRLTWSFEAPTDAEPFYIRIPQLDRLRHIIPDQAGVFDDQGRFIESARHETDNGTELWFEAEPGRHYFSGWTPGRPLPQATRQEQQAHFETIGQNDNGMDLLDDLIATVLDRPEHFNIQRQVAIARPDRLLRQSTWRVESGAAVQESPGRNIFLVSRQAFGDIKLTLEVHPGRATYAGIAVAVEDTALPDTSGIYWLMGADQEPGQTGYYRTWGHVRSDEPGPQMTRGEWNRLRARIEDGRVSLQVNDEPPRLLELPDAWSGSGHVALATFGGSARFRDIRVTEIETDTLAFSDQFAGDGFDDRHWIDGNDRSEQGFVRVRNTSGSPQRFTFTHLKHRDPFFSRNQRFEDTPTAPGDVTPWRLMNDLYHGQPYSLMFGDQTGGTVEFATHPHDDAIVRRLAFPDDEGLTVEITRANFDRAEQILTSREISTALLDDVKAMTFVGSRPEHFRIGWPDGHRLMWEAGRRLGFNLVKIGPSERHAVPFDELGFTYINAFCHWVSQFARGGGGYRRAGNASEAERVYQRWENSGLADRVVQIDVYDEAGIGPGSRIRGDLPDLSKDPDAWDQIIRNAGLTPKDFIRPDNPPPDGLDPMSTEYWEHVKFYGLDARETNPQGVYNSLKAHDGIWWTRFHNYRQELHRQFGDHVRVTANIMYTTFFSDSMAGLDPFILYGPNPALDMPQVCDYKVGWPQQEEFLIDLLRCAQRPNPPDVQAYLASQVSFASRSRRSLQLRAFAALGAGARSMNFYRWGPRYGNTENWYDTDRPRLQTIGDIAHAIGFVDRILAEGGPRQSRIAILHSIHDARWDSLDRYRHSQSERRVLFHLLRSLHHQPDFIADEIPPPAQGINWDDYRVIFISQRTMTDATADDLLAWVRRGGHLIALGHCGELDAMGQPWNRMTSAFGLQTIRPLESDTHRAIEGSTIGTHAAGAMLVEAADAGDEQAWFSDGTPAKIARAYGEGRMVYLPFQLGRSYHHGGSYQARMKSDVLLGMQMDLLAWTAPLLEPAGLPVAATDNPLIGARLIESEHGTAVILLNTTGAPEAQSVTVSVQHPGNVTVESLYQGPLTARQTSDGRLTFELAMGLTDIVRLQPEAP